jgi:hypothetical protein
MERALEYEKNNVSYDCRYERFGINCKNHELCGEVLPDWWWDCKRKYLCTNCDVQFGNTLETIEITECPICLEEKKGISQPNCSHPLCIGCFKRCYYGEDKEGEPHFPYPDIFEEYTRDQFNPKWNRDYPLITAWDEAWNMWDDARNMKYEMEENLRVCPLCRK